MAANEIPSAGGVAKGRGGVPNGWNYWQTYSESAFCISKRSEAAIIEGKIIFCFQGSELLPPIFPMIGKFFAANSGVRRQPTGDGALYGVTVRRQKRCRAPLATALQIRAPLEFVTIDANHPMAGKDLTFELELGEIV
jgi:hypothetical protein